jgi:hypothetical protein
LPDAAAAAAIVGVGVIIFSGVFFLGGLDSRVSTLDSKFDALDSKIDRMMLVNVALILVFGFSMTYFAQLK